jgi:hypothetical protein
MCPIFERCLEKVLFLAYQMFKKLETTNKESYRGLPSTPSQNMKLFAERFSLLSNTAGLDMMGASLGANDEAAFSMTIAKKLFDALVKVGS